MSVYTFDPAAFKVAYPEFSALTDAVLTQYFSFAQAVLLDNTDGSPVVDTAGRGFLFNLLVAHQAQLAANPGQPAGRVSQFTEGSVSGSLEWTGTTPAQGAAWYLQTQYGATFWQATYRYRMFMWRAPRLNGYGDQ